MKAKDILLIVIGLVAGALLALGVRSAVHNPYQPEPQSSTQEHSNHSVTPPAPATPSDPHAGHGNVSPTTPQLDAPQSVVPTTPAPAPTPAPDPHAEHTKGADHVQNNAVKTVNTICSLCGGPVDPKTPTITYKGHVIGFGCAPCPKTFAEDPDRYLPYYLKNELVPD